MPGDRSRNTFHEKNHFSGVLSQQGRVNLDADWNEQWEIEQHRIGTETIDVIGQTGVPKKGNGFLIGLASSGRDLVILPGRIYIDGLLFELDDADCDATYFHQPYYPNPDTSFFISSPPGSPVIPSSPPCEHPASPPEAGALNMIDGTYLVYLEGRQREITWLEFPAIHEVALGEADTTTRIQNIWQVKLLALNQAAVAGGVTCKGSLSQWDDLRQQSTGRMQARTNPVAPTNNPCELPPQAGYLGLENQLYRIEIQNSGIGGVATYKWSRENASIASKILSIDGINVTVADFGRDDVLGFAPGQWVEILSDESELQTGPNPLLQISTIQKSARTITLSSTAAAYASNTNLRLRRWDQSDVSANASGLPTTPGWQNIENGIQINFTKGNYRAGDYWLIPARTATASIEWPEFPDGSGLPMPELPRGPRLHLCRLGIITAKSGQITIQDCRPLFPSLSTICAEDICFNNTHCKLSGADNVQEALDILCASNAGGQIFSIEPHTFCRDDKKPYFFTSFPTISDTKKISFLSANSLKLQSNDNGIFFVPADQDLSATTEYYPSLNQSLATYVKIIVPNAGFTVQVFKFFSINLLILKANQTDADDYNWVITNDSQQAFVPPSVLGNIGVTLVEGSSHILSALPEVAGTTAVQPSTNISAIAGINALQPSAVELRDTSGTVGTPSAAARSAAAVASGLPAAPPPTNELVRNITEVRASDSFLPLAGTLATNTGAAPVTNAGTEAAAGINAGAAAGINTGAAVNTGALDAASLANILSPSPVLSELIPTAEAQQIRLSLMSKEELLPLPDQLPPERVLSITLTITYNLGIDGHTKCSDTRRFSILTRILNADMAKNVHTLYKSQ